MYGASCREYVLGITLRCAGKLTHGFKKKICYSSPDFELLRQYNTTHTDRTGGASRIGWRWRRVGAGIVFYRLTLSEFFMAVERTIFYHQARRCGKNVIGDIITASRKAGCESSRPG